MSVSRRQLLSGAAHAMAGIAFAGCGFHRTAWSQTAPAAQARRREVVIAGKRVRTIDVHAHCHIPEALALVDKQIEVPGLLVGPERIKAMDEQGIDIEALSINPNFWDKAERDAQAQIVKVQNESSSSSAPRSQSGLSGSPPWPWRTLISPPSSWTRRSTNSGCAAP